MARAHLLKTITDAAGNALVGTQIRVLRPGTNTLVADDFFGSDAGLTPLANPFSTPTGVVSIYMETPQRVSLGVTVAANPEVIYADLDVLVPALSGFQSAADTPFAPTVTITAENVQDAIETLYDVANTAETHAGDGFESTQVGPGAVAASDQGTALGHDASASTFQATALGEGTVASGTGSTAGGQAAAATANQTTALGANTEAPAVRATAVGANAVAEAVNSTALGSEAHAVGPRSTAVGRGAEALDADTFVARGDTLVVQPSGPSSHATQVQVFDTADVPHTIGAVNDGLLFDGVAPLASTISFVSVGTIAATDVQAAIAEVATDAATALSDHLADTTDAHDASAISVVPVGSISATDVQAALAELASEKYGPDNAPPYTGPTITQGAGLPAFTGRKANDLHYDNTTGKTSILTGTPGATASDTFNRVNSTGLGTSSSGALWSARGGSAADVVSNAAVPTSGGAQNYVAVAAGSQTDQIDYIDPGGTNATDMGVFVRLDETSGVTHDVGIAHDGTGGAIYLDMTFKRGGTTLSTVTTTVTRVAGRRYTVSASSVGAVLTGIVTDTVTGATFMASATDGGAALGASNTKAGFRGQTGLVMDNFDVLANGTLAWTFTEPIYIQAQLVSGNVSTGTHVLKPGVRVPTDSTLREVILRCDTAPVGASITVEVERFNNGVSQGVIATTSITTGNTVGSLGSLSAGVAKGDILKFNITSIGSTTAGADLTISLDFH